MTEEVEPARSGTSDSAGGVPIVALAGVALALPAIVLACAICALIPAVPWWVGIPIGIAAAAATVWLRLRRAIDSVLSSLNAEPAQLDELARLDNVVQGLALAGGVSEPELFTVADDGRNIAALAQGDRTAVVVSTGLLAAVDRIGLEGIVAEALVRIRSGDAAAATRGTALFGSLLGGPVAAVSRPIAVRALRSMLPADRDLTADRDAVALTRYPPGLLAAFNQIQAGSAQLAAATPAHEHLWLVPPTTVDKSDDGAVSTAPLELRIDVLGEL